ncbi:MAG TPA: ATPase, T2SS/T4P/T4SS family [Candidatus Dormibacteraeota bacterium]|nr:ATPase, T2SS/T4P/T4SS family [Candidatus Dormibacteraeota bacterium]
MTNLAPPTLEEVLRARVEAELAAELARRDRTRLRVEDQGWIYQLVGRLVGEETALDGTQAQETWRRIFASVTPLGPLAEHLADPDVEEVRINGTEACFVFKAGRRQAVAPPFDDEDALIELVHWYTDGTPTARLDRASPTVTMTLPEGSRLHAALSPPARPMSVTIRKHPPARFVDLAALAASGFLPKALIEFLETAVAARLNILVSGGAGAGKTTFMRVLARLIAPDERVVTIEDQAELHLWRELPDCIALEGRPSNTEGRGAITIQMLIHEALRMSPDRIIIGEVRGAEALDLLDAMNTGHPGSVCTLHADSPRETLPRLVRLALRNPQAPRAEAVLAEVVHTVDLVLHAGIVRDPVDQTRGRKLLSVGCVAGLDDGRPQLQELVALRPDGRWHRVGSTAAMPQRVWSKLAQVFDPARLLDGFDD